MGFLDNTGLAHLCGKLRAALAGKQDKLEPDGSVRLEDGRIGVALPTKAVTQAEYGALSEEEKRNGTLYMTSGAAFDGGGSPVPTGAVLSFLARNAPYGYLICDGKEYPIAMYPRLAQYIREHFGEANHFGGDGETTFAVPDMRNLFLRGYHGEAEETLSWEVGERQEATKIPYFYGPRLTPESIGYIAYGNVSNGATNLPEHPDILNSSNQCAQLVEGRKLWLSREDVPAESGNVFEKYAARPVNMAVLYCIKT